MEEFYTLKPNFGSSAAITATDLLATMSQVYESKIFIDRSATPKGPGTGIVAPDRPSVFILLPGGWSGDMWHCAAATILCQSEDTDVIAAYAITIIGMKEKVEFAPDGSEKVVVSPTTSILHGSRTYNYFHSVQVPVPLARINRLETQFRPLFSKNIIGGSGKYLNKIINLYRDHFGDPESVCSKMWSLTPETEKDANVDTLHIPVHFFKPPSLSVRVLFPNEGERHELAGSDIYPPYQFNGNEEHLSGPENMLHLWTSTTITMQYLTPPETRSRRIRYLQEQLGNVSKVDSTWAQQARALADKLVMLATQEGVDRSNNKRVIIFNYRKGDVNKQHDGNMRLLKFVSTIAEAKGFVVIALLVNIDLEEVDILRINNHVVLKLYSPGESYDKRYTAAFWSIVANELQGPIVEGLIGGRSGSMDIAAFMGVNTCSFDEPIFGDKYKFEDAYILAQGGQLLRLLSQHPIMSIVYVNTDSWYSKWGGRHNSYMELEKKELERWLDRAPGDPHICPPITEIEVRHTPAGRKSLESALVRMEHDVMGIKAVSLRALLGIQ
ncbi:hypothetical protein V494_00707 [Pseudogymnoascus sp. VKM F-4513 (FW-928)]|nr:hypothetical protein V494_00707 [Pseudogymnoascus sp. VKM F-4513 (FW-928)]